MFLKKAIYQERNRVIGTLPNKLVMLCYENKRFRSDIRYVKLTRPTTAIYSSNEGNQIADKQWLLQDL